MSAIQNETQKCFPDVIGDVQLIIYYAERDTFLTWPSLERHSSMKLY